MRPLPRLHAYTDGTICRAADFGVRAAAIAAGGDAVALYARDPTSTAAQLTAFAKRLLALARPPGAAVIVSGRPDIAQALEAHGVQLRANDLSPSDARRVFARGWLGRSVHSLPEAEHALAEGAEYLVVGHVFETPAHREHSPIGLPLLGRIAALGAPVVAIGGMTPARVAVVRDAGAWGIAAMSALWHAADSAAAARAFLGSWAEAA